MEKTIFDERRAAFKARKDLTLMSNQELMTELSWYRNVDYGRLLELLLNGLLWVIMNWKTVKAEIDRILQKNGK